MPAPTDRPEIWAGIECTVNRVGDRYFDQLTKSGHDRRPEDLDRLAALGVRAVRYPVLWERTEPSPDRPADWAWADERLGRLRRLGVRPIIGLVHHGSGPPHTSLTEPGFADGLAGYAGRVAERYPWVDAYTPVNEPLTTARFAGLYGYWYPHGRSDPAFARCLLNQCRAVVLAMAAVRRVNPGATLVQTDDLGQTHAPPALAYQAEFENHRRWVTWDLLCGMVNRHHPLWKYFLAAGITDSELAWFADRPCPPDVIGVNYYITSERYLDDRLDRYPSASHGGNGKHRYADVEAVRVLPDGPAGAAGLLRQAWDRYRRPLAVTESHLGCTREEQLRWLAETWSAACRVRSDGADVRAVTAWSALGAFDWDSLVTRESGFYEPGAFDVRANPPRPTALAGLIRDLAAGREPDHPVVAGPGWWHRPIRLLAPSSTSDEPPTPGARPLLITGGNGNLARAFARVCRIRGLAHVALTRRDLDIADPKSVLVAVERFRPWAILNAAGYVRVDDAESQPDLCMRENVYGPTVLAAVCADRPVRLATFSADLVFDGRSERPYRETDPVGPLNVYGVSKAEAERRVLALDPETLVVRTSALFGPWDGVNFVSQTLRALRGGRVIAAADDITVTPSYLPDVCNATLDLLIDGETGVWHLSGPDPLTWAELARTIACKAGLNMDSVEGCPATRLGWRAPRPVNSALASGRGYRLPSLTDGLSRYLQHCDLLATA